MNTKVILFLTILVIFLYRFKQQEGFSSAEKDIRASFNIRGISLKRDKNGKICKIGEKHKHKKKKMKNDEDIDDEDIDDEDIDDEDMDDEDMDDEETISGGKPIILEKESDLKNEELLKINEKLDFMKERRNEFLPNNQEQNNQEIISNIKQIIHKNDRKELEKINELTNKINLLHSELQNSKEKEQMFDKLLDKIHTVPPVIQKPVSKDNSKKIILIVVLVVLFTLGGFLIYNISTSNKIGDGASLPLTSNYKDELIKAKKQILSEVI